MKKNGHAGFYLSIEDLNYLDNIMSMLSDFVNIILDQAIEDLDRSVKTALQEVNLEGDQNPS